MKPSFVQNSLLILIILLTSCRRPPEDSAPSSPQALHPPQTPPAAESAPEASRTPPAAASPETETSRTPATAAPPQTIPAQPPLPAPPETARRAYAAASPEASLKAPPAADPLTPAAPPPAFHRIDGVGWTAQTWNNCGPANLAIVMNFWGRDIDQADIKAVIRPHDKDPHAAIDDLAAFARDAGLNASVYWNSDLESLKAHVAAGRPVIAPAWHIDANGEEMGHYRTVYGYSDEERIVFIRDTLDGPDYALTYADFDFLWGVYNRPLILITPPSPAEAAAPAPADSPAAPVHPPNTPSPPHHVDRAPGSPPPAPDSLNITPARAEALSLFAEGMARSDKGEHAEAAAIFERAAELGLPWRIWWYFPRGLASYAAAGMNERLLAVVRAALTPYPYSEELHYWAARAQDSAGDIQGAAASLTTSLSLKPGWLNPEDIQTFSPALRARLPASISP